MAMTTFNDTTNPALVRDVLSRRAWLWAQKNSFFSQFTKKQNINDTRTGGQNMKGVEANNSANAIISLREEPKLKKRQKVNVYIRQPLVGDGVIDNEPLVDNEEQMTYFEQEVQVHLRRTAVANYLMDEFRSEVNIQNDAVTAIGEWLAQITDTDQLLALSGLANSVGTLAAVAPTSGRVWFGGQTTNGAVERVATLILTDSVTTNLFGPKVISAVKRLGMESTADRPKLRPITHKGKDYFVMFCHPLQIKALRNDAAWVSANQDGWHRGEDNPIFSGAEGIWDGVIIHSWEKIETRLGDASVAASVDPAAYFELGDGGANGIMTARALFCGAGAGMFVVGKNLFWNKKTETDYGNQEGIAGGAIYNTAKTNFNSNDYGVIAVNTAVVSDS